MNEWDEILMEREVILKKLMGHMTWTRDRALAWFETPNPMFGGLSAEYLVMSGRAAKVHKIIDALMNGDLP